MKIKVINGPNINLLGLREPEIYGKTSYQDMIEKIRTFALSQNIEVDFYQSNHEGDLVDEIQKTYSKYDGIIINPAAYTHTSIAILDALKAVNLPTVEVHISKPCQRESFRHTSFVSYYAEKTISGRGVEGYIDAVKYLLSKKQS